MAREPKPDRPISLLETGATDMDFVWRKIAAAGDMKSAIKHFLDWWDWYDPKDGTDRGVALVKELRETMEAYLNCSPNSPTSSSPEPLGSRSSS